MASPQTEEFFDLIASSQSRRLDDQRASVGNLPGLRITHNNLGHLRVEGDAQEPGDDFFNMLMKCQVGAGGGTQAGGVQAGASWPPWGRCTRARAVSAEAHEWGWGGDLKQRLKPI